MRFLFVNQFVPPDEAPTSLLLGDLAAALEREGHTVIWVGGRKGYRTRKVKPGGRARREVVSLCHLLWSGWRAPRCEVILSLSSPPMLLVVAHLLKWRHRRAKLVHWAMDLYPEVAVALGEVADGSWLHKLTAWMMGRSYRACDLVVALDAEMAERIARHEVTCLIHSPWPPAMIEQLPVTEEPASLHPDIPTNKPFCWIYSGNLGRAHEWETLLQTQRILEERGLAIHLIFQGGGPERSKAEARSEELGLQSCHWRSYAPGDQLLESLLAGDALIVTQKPVTQGCLWPSKLALALLVERPIIWVGCGRGTTGNLLREGGHIVVEPGQAGELADAVEQLCVLSQRTPKPIMPTALGQKIEAARNLAIGNLHRDLLASVGGKS
jgi:colanic acid biosynthesis glycosyl transferase WcaI